MTAEPTPARLPPQERREQILASAIRLFEERPHTSVSTAEIAAAAGVARPLIHHYFGTRRDLYIEVLRRLYFIPPIEPAELPAPDGEAETKCYQPKVGSVLLQGRKTRAPVRSTRRGFVVAVM